MIRSVLWNSSTRNAFKRNFLFQNEISNSSRVRQVSSSVEGPASLVTSIVSSDENKAFCQNRYCGTATQFKVQPNSMTFPSNFNSSPIMLNYGNSTMMKNSQRCFSSSSTVSRIGGPIVGSTIVSCASPEEEIAKFEQNASAAETAVETAVATTDGLVWESTWWPQDQMLDFIVYAHGMSGANYAITIGAITLAFRTFMFPMFVKSQRNSSRMAHLKPEMDVLKERIDQLDPKDLQLQQEYAKKMQALFRKYDVNPLGSLVIPLVQMPVFMSMFFALRKMPDYFSTELSDGGILWFTDLAAPDPYMILPVTSALTFLLMMEMGKEQMLATSPQQGKLMLTFFRSIAVVMIPLTMNFSSAVFCYWTVNNTFSFAQSALFKSASVRKSLGIWDTPKPVPGAPKPKGINEMLQDFMQNKTKDSGDANLKERIEAHNAMIEQKKGGRRKRK